MNDRDLKQLLKRNHRASMDLSGFKEYRLKQRSGDLPPLEDWDLSDQMDRLRLEYVGLREAYDGLLNARQLTLSATAAPIRGAAQISARHMLNRIADLSSALDGLVWLLEDSGLLTVARASGAAR